MAWRTLAGLAAIAFATSLLAASGTALMRLLWEPATRITFWLVQHLLTPVLAIHANPVERILEAHGFTVRVAPECSGLEGAGLMLVFGSVWLWLFRQEFRFPRALMLLPAGVVVAFALNVFRIAALMLIGSIGGQAVAAGGFHSQAGWIAFNAAAFGFAIVARRVRWLRVHATGLVEDVQAPANPVAPFLVPFLAILAAGIVATAMSGGFEWLYPLRFIACCSALWMFRDRYYRGLRWSVSWFAPAAGIGVFVVWIGFDHWARGASSAMPLALGGASAGARTMWIAVRVIAASITVPIAEELAFRGFLLRRLGNTDFEMLDPRRVGLPALLGSSLIFGLMHGALWHAGAVAGLVYALAYRSRQSIGDAIVAHGLTNALLAVYVLTGPNWRLW